VHEIERLPVHRARRLATFDWLETPNDPIEGNREPRIDGVTSSADCISRIGDGSLRKFHAAICL
jgi:hypothetical protein